MSKLFYKIGEVSELTGIKPYILRYWESEFGLIKPVKNKRGQRLYKESDIKRILKIKKLLYEDKYTIAGTKRAIQMMGRDREGGLQKKSLMEVIDEQAKGLRWILDFIRSRENL